MAFYRTKFTKGHPYLYFEWRWREHGKVRSDGYIVASLNRQTGEVWSKRVSKAMVKRSNMAAEDVADLKDQQQEIDTFFREVPAKLASGWGADKIEAAPRPKRVYGKPPSKTPGTKSKPSVSSIGRTEQGDAKLDLRIQFRKFKVSEQGMQQEYEAHQQMMRNMGSNASQMAPVMVRHPRRLSDFVKGIQGNVSRSKRMGTYVVTMPRWKRGNEKKTKQEYRKALAHSVLDGMAKAKPEHYAALKTVAEQVRRTRNKALAQYIRNTGSKTKLARSLAIGTPLAHMHAIPISKHKKLDPATLGLPEYGKRKSWREEFASLMAEAADHAPKVKGKGQKPIDYGEALVALGKDTDRRLRSVGAGIRIVSEEMRTAPLLERLSGKNRDRAKQLRRLYARQVLFTEKKKLIKASIDVLIDGKKPTVEPVSRKQRRQQIREGIQAHKQLYRKGDLPGPKGAQKPSLKAGMASYHQVRKLEGREEERERYPGEGRARFLYAIGAIERDGYHKRCEKLRERHETLTRKKEFGIS